MIHPLLISVTLGILSYFVTLLVIPLVSDLFIKKGVFGKDLLKPSAPVRAESMGVIVGVVYFVMMFIFIPIPFLPWIKEGEVNNHIEPFPNEKFAQLLGGLLALISMMFLGFADDVLDVRWRVKIWFPLIASTPLFMVYYITYGKTDVLVPLPLRSILGRRLLHLGPLYYVYLGCLSTFSTNAINIIAGANGVEVIQIVVITISLIINSALQMHLNSSRAESLLMTLYFLIPFLGSNLGFMHRNWYPAECFGGDTLVYFGGMVFAVVGVLGNLSKTVLLFMIPQALNFLLSCPQLFKFVDCPRHRMPRLSSSGNTIEYSTFKFKPLKTNRQRLGRLFISILEFMQLARVKRTKTGRWVECNNLTLINVILMHCGPMKESRLSLMIGLVQMFGSIIGFVIRYGLVHVIYDSNGI